MPRPGATRTIVLAAALIAGAALYFAWDAAPLVQLREGLTREGIETWVDRAGIWGPALVIGLMAVAVVASPIPSAPIALAAGAAYGHATGTTLVVAGAEAGALIAFGLARLLGRDAIERWFGDRIDMSLLGSQNALTLTVLVSRLLPFVSFDLVSYAAGLSRLHFWRFALATLAGVIPAAFLLAHFGGEAASAEIGPMTWAVLALGLVTGLPLVWAALRDWKGARGTR